MGLWKTLTTINGNSLVGLILKLTYDVPHMSDDKLMAVITRKQKAPEFIRMMAAKESQKRALKK